MSFKQYPVFNSFAVSFLWMLSSLFLHDNVTEFLIIANDLYRFRFKLAYKYTITNLNRQLVNVNQFIIQY